MSRESLSMSRLPIVGRVIGDWRCESQLGTGSFGIVHVWRNERNGESIALKKCRFGPEVALSDKHKEQWKQEVDIMQRLKHQNVVRCRPPPDELVNLDGVLDPLPLLCMEYCSGGDLRKVLNTPENCIGLPQEQVIHIVSDLASALGFLHNRRIIHRDLKPENVVLKVTPERVVYKLIDLGYAKELGQSSLALSFVGTLQYLAPELFLSKEYTKSVDYWSLGLITFEIITGFRPFLPNLSPGQWMEHVRVKSFEVICISEEDSGEKTESESDSSNKIVFLEHLVPENLLSKTLQSDMERWLRLLLEWDSTKRGKGPTGDVCVFRDLQHILGKFRIKIVKIDDPCARLDMEINEKMLGETLAQKVHELCRTTSVKNTLILMADGKQIVFQDNLQFQLNKLDENIDRSTLYILDMSCQRSLSELLKGVSLTIPKSIQPFLQNPRKEVTFRKRKQVYAHAYFFIRQHQLNWALMVKGVSTFSLHVMNNIKDLNASSLILSKSYERSVAKLDLFKESLRHDIDKYKLQAQKKDHITSKQIFESWIESEKILQTEFEHWKKRLSGTDDAVKRMTATSSEVSVISKPEIEKLNDLQVFVNEAIRKIESLKRIPIDGRKEKDNVLEVAQLIVKFLKQRDRCLEAKMSQFMRLHELHERIHEIISVQADVLQGFDSFCVSVSKLQRRRQSDLWKLLSAAVGQRSVIMRSSRTGSQEHISQQSSSSSAIVPANLVSSMEDTRKAIDLNITLNEELERFVSRMTMDDA